MVVTSQDIRDLLLETFKKEKSRCEKVGLPGGIVNAEAFFEKLQVWSMTPMRVIPFHQYYFHHKSLSLDTLTHASLSAYQ